MRGGLQVSAVFEEKDMLRKKIRRQMRQMELSLHKDADATICRKTTLLSQFQSARTIFCFVGVDWEIDTRPLINYAINTMKRVAVPLCTGSGLMEARLIDSLEQLRPGSYGIPEPPSNGPICPLSEIDFTVVPCVACDSSCMRLGQGGGFYDRFMGSASFFTAALCRDAALLKQVPKEPWDCPVDCVVTELRTYFR